MTKFYKFENFINSIILCATLRRFNLNNITKGITYIINILIEGWMPLNLYTMSVPVPLSIGDSFYPSFRLQTRNGDLRVGNELYDISQNPFFKRLPEVRGAAVRSEAVSLNEYFFLILKINIHKTCRGIMGIRGRAGKGQIINPPPTHSPKFLKHHPRILHNSEKFPDSLLHSGQGMEVESDRMTIPSYFSFIFHY